ncbi:MAG: AAA family ATPase [Candidatus Bathyarchaeota archaeon]|nr:AAA family ATPase [Candidatus Bathyarchaeota archaeon]MDH5662971.1 AAA family ATPase [Candidatus Bathyarchaeota archaeon]
MSENRVSTGIDGLDPLIEGGFPRGSLVLLAGNPGTGKTIFGMQFLYRGAEDYGENGIYVSFAENEDTIIHNISRLFGRDLRKREEGDGKVKILDFTTVTEKGLSTVLEMILEEVTRLKAKRLVIDSFSAMAQAFKEPIEARIIVHNILGKIVRQLGCTTLFIVEVPTGSEKIGISIEEFVADGVVVLRRDDYDGKLIREIEIPKLRGTKIERQKFLFTLNKGFEVFPPFSNKKVENPKKFEPTRGTKTHYPSGIPELDEILGGEGYPRGFSVLYELGENVPVDALDVVVNPTIANFIMRDRGFITVPVIEYGPEDIRKMISSFTGEEEFDKYARITTYPNPMIDTKKPYIITWRDPTVEDIGAIENFNLYIQEAVELSSKIGKNVVHLLSGDNLIYITERFNSGVVGRSVIANRLGKDLMIYVSKPSIPEITKVFADTLSMHFKIEERNGSMILYGKKPKTIIYNIKPDASRGCRVKLTPIV